MARQPRDTEPSDMGPERGAEGAQFIRDIVKDPANVPDVMRLYGYVGASSEENHERLYLTPDLSAYVEIPTDAILHRMAVPREQDPQGGVVLWVRQDAALKQKTSPAASGLAHYFAGALQAAAAAGLGAAQAQALPIGSLPQAFCPPSPACSLPQALCGHTPVLPCPPPSPPVVCQHSPPVVCRHSPPIVCQHSPPDICGLRTPELPCISMPVHCVSVPVQFCPAPQAMAQPQMMGPGMGQPVEAAFTVQVFCPTRPAVCLHTPVVVCPPPSPPIFCHPTVIHCPPTPPIVCQHSPVVFCHHTLIGCPPFTPFCPVQSLACPPPGGSLACGGGFGGGGFGTM